MGKLLLFGILGSAFFSSSFVLYELMSVQGGHWFWSASLRCLFMWLLVSMIILIQKRFDFNYLIDLKKLFIRFFGFWCLVGSVGFGTYGLLAFAADYAVGWVVAATFLFTVVAGLFILMVFGQRFTLKVLGFCVLVFVGVVLANLGEGIRQEKVASWQTMLLFGALPAFLASFCFPIGNQLIWQASSQNGVKWAWLPSISSQLLNNPLSKVWLMSAGSLPMWAVLWLILRPPIPSGSQVGVSFLVALSAGVIGTSVFLYARSLAKTPAELAAVDATQGSEIIFALLFGILLLATPMPSLVSIVGVGLVMLGLAMFTKS